jgi:hypothetical protein
LHVLLELVHNKRALPLRLVRLVEEAQKLSLFDLLDEDDAFARAWDGAGNTDNTQFHINQRNLKVLGGHLVMAHAAGHALAFKNLLRIHRANRTNAAITAATVRFAAAVEVVSFYGTGKPLTFACAGHLYGVPNTKNVGCYF